MHRNVLIALIVFGLVLGACSSEDDSSTDPADGETREQEQNKPTTPLEVEAETAPLRTIMVQLERNMQAIGSGLWRHDFQLIARGAEQIHGHPKIPKKERKKLQSILGEEDFQAFMRDDKTVHNKAKELHQAAEEEDFSAAAQHFKDLQQGCISCHQNHRDTIVEHPDW